MSKRSRGLLPTPQAIDGQGKERPLRFKNDGQNRDPSQPGSWRGDLKDHLAFSSPPDSPASPSQPQDEEEERMTTATSGLRLWQSSPLSGRIGSCLRMLLESSVWYSPTVRLEWQAKPLFSQYRLTKSQTTPPSSEESSETSDKQGMRQFGWLYQLAVSERPTDETGCGYLLSTPQATDGSAGGIISEEDKFWTLPSGRLRRINRSGTDGSLGLAREIQMLRTPSEADYRYVGPKEGHGRVVNGVEAQVMLRKQISWEDGKRTGMKLHSDFVCWMQGYPLDWLDVD